MQKKLRVRRFVSLFLAFALVFSMFSGFGVMQIAAAPDDENGLQPNVLWSLQTDEYIQSLETGSETLLGTETILSRAGGVTVTAVENPGDSGLVSLAITGRSADWHGVEFAFSALTDGLGMTIEDGAYHIYVSVRRTAPATGNGQLALRGHTAPWANLAGSTSNTSNAIGQNMIISWPINFTALANRNLRIQAAGSAGANNTMSFIIDNIVISSLPYVSTGITPNAADEITLVQGTTQNLWVARYPAGSQLPAGYTVVWASSNTEVATVAPQTGNTFGSVVTAAGIGTATVTAQLMSGDTAVGAPVDFAVNVTPTPIADGLIRVGAQTRTMMIDSSANLAVTLTPALAALHDRTVIWTSDDDAVTVTSVAENMLSAVVTAGPIVGDATVTASLMDGEIVVDYVEFEVNVLGEIVWSLATDEDFQALDHGRVVADGVNRFDSVPTLGISGPPAVYIIPNPAEGVNNSIDVRDRAGGEVWWAIDAIINNLIYVDSESRVGIYAIRVTGSLPAPATVATDMRLIRPDPGWSLFAGSAITIPVGGQDWVINYTFTQTDISDFVVGNQRGVRITNDQTGFRHPYIIHNIELIALDRSVFTVQIPYWDLNEPSLAAAFEEYFFFGNIWSTQGRMDMQNTQYAFVHHFNAITGENVHKVDHFLGPAPNAWDYNFDGADHVVDWAEERNIAMIGHTLAWHSQSRPWLTHTAEGPVTRQQAIYNMHRHISTVAGRYAGRMYSWDVLNEAVLSGGPGDAAWNANPNWRAHLRNPGVGQTRWQAAFANGADIEAGECGTDFVYYAFKFARMYDPFAILYYNDYNEEIPSKRNVIVDMIRSINTRWAHDMENNHEAVPEGEEYTGRLLIEAMGMQAHYHLAGWTTNFNNVYTALQAYVDLGVRVSVTELDITIGGFGGAAVPPPGPARDALFATQADRYAQLFEWYLANSDSMGRVSLWGKTDDQSWRSAGFPLLFDHLFQTKPAFDAILATLEDAPAPNISRPVVTSVMHLDGVARTDMNLVIEPDEPFAVQFLASQNNNAPLFWRVEGELPLGLRMIARTGAIIGTPTAGGEFSFNVVVDNARYTSEPVQVTITVEPPCCEAYPYCDCADEPCCDVYPYCDCADEPCCEAYPYCDCADEPCCEAYPYCDCADEPCCDVYPYCDCAEEKCCDVYPYCDCDDQLPCEYCDQHPCVCYAPTPCEYCDQHPCVCDDQQPCEYCEQYPCVCYAPTPCEYCDEHPCVCDDQQPCEYCEQYPCICDDQQPCEYCEQYPCVCDDTTPQPCAICGNLPCTCPPIQIPQWPPWPPQIPIIPPQPPVTVEAPPAPVSIPWTPRSPVQQPPTDDEPTDVYYIVLPTEEVTEEEPTEEPTIEPTDVTTPPTDPPTLPTEPPTPPTIAPPTPSVNTLIFTVGSTEYMLNGQLRVGVGEAFIDAAADRMMIPLRTLAEALGVEVEWDNATRSALVHLASGTLVIPADEMLPDGMGSAMIIGDRVFVPLRFVMYAFDAEVRWDSVNRAAVITW